MYLPAVKTTEQIGYDYWILETRYSVYAENLRAVIYVLVSWLRKQILKDNGSIVVGSWARSRWNLATGGEHPDTTGATSRHYNRSGRFTRTGGRSPTAWAIASDGGPSLDFGSAHPVSEDSANCTSLAHTRTQRKRFIGLLTRTIFMVHTAQWEMEFQLMTSTIWISH